MNIALPSAQSALHFSNDDRQWIVTAYSLAFGSLLLLGGKLSDLFGRKWTFIIGLTGFALSSAVGGAAQSFLMLAVARAFQGAFGALLAPAALSLLTTTFTESSERNKAFGLYGAIAALRRVDRAAARRYPDSAAQLALLHVRECGVRGDRGHRRACAAGECR